MSLGNEFGKAAQERTITIGGQAISYRAQASSLLLKDKKDETVAQMSYTAYTRTNAGEAAQRPLAFIYNGGPGSSSVWLHMGAFGPRRVETVDAGPTAPPPYTISDNSFSLLDKADLVFIDPVGTGFSRAMGKAEDKDFWGVDQDAQSLAQFIRRYVSENQRWNSPKFLIGESYGTFRSAVLVNHLQTQDNMAFNGVVLISNVLDMGQIRFHPGQDLPYMLYMPSYAATAHYHGLVKNAPDLENFLADAREFAGGKYAVALAKGARITQAEKSSVARKLSQFTGLSKDYLEKANLRVALPQFLAQAQRDRGLITARMDSRFSGAAADLHASAVYADPQMTAVGGAFTAAANAYLRDELQAGENRNYEILNYAANSAWDWKHKGLGNGGGAANAMQDLAQAIITNPHLKVEVENGYYDMATPFYASEYTIDHLGLPASLQGNIEHRYYKSGHMMYLRQADLEGLKNNVAAFIDKASGLNAKPAPAQGPRP